MMLFFVALVEPVMMQKKEGRAWDLCLLIEE